MAVRTDEVRAGVKALLRVLAEVVVEQLGVVDAVTGVQHGLVIRAVTEADARPEQLPIPLVKVSPSCFCEGQSARNVAGGRVRKMRVQGGSAVEHLAARIGDVPAQPHVDGQLARGLKVVLDERRPVKSAPAGIHEVKVEKRAVGRP